MIQYHLDRLYFGHGLEAGVYRNCRFAIAKGDKAVYFGCVESSHQGVSYSYPTGGFFDTLAVDSVTVLIEPVEIDTATNIVLGDVNALLISPEQSPTDPEDTRVLLKHYASRFEMISDFESGVIDGCFSFHRYRPLNSSIRLDSTPAPYFVALLPNPGRPCNEQGFLITSLYYRFDQAQLTLLFEGDNARPFNCLTYHADDCLRHYRYDPEAGRTLLAQLKPRPDTVAIGGPHRQLSKVTGYFGDVLARNQIKVRQVLDTGSADIFCAVIPLKQGDALHSLDHIYGLLVRDTIAGGNMNQQLAIIGDHLAAARETTDPDLREHYCRLAESGLRDDIGVYPLFRPMVYFAHREELSRFSFDPTGLPDFSQLIRIHVPAASAECLR